MGINEGFAAFEHCPSRDAVRLQEVHRLIVVALLRPGCEKPIQLSLVCTTREDGRKPGVVGQVRLTNGPAQPAPFRIGTDGDGDPHIVALARIHALRHHVGVSVAHGTGHTARHRVIQDILSQHGDSHFPL